MLCHRFIAILTPLGLLDKRVLIFNLYNNTKNTGNGFQ